MDYLELQSFNEDMKKAKNGIENFKNELVRKTMNRSR